MIEDLDLDGDGVLNSEDLLGAQYWLGLSNDNDGDGCRMLMKMTMMIMTYFR